MNVTCTGDIMSGSKRKAGQETIVGPIDCVEDPQSTWFLDYYNLNGIRLPRIHFFSVKVGKGDFVDRGVVQNIEEDMNDSGKACIRIEVSKGRKWLLHPGCYAFSRMNTQSKDSMLSRGWYAEPDQPSEVTIDMIIRHYTNVCNSFGGSKSPLSKKAKVDASTHEVHIALQEYIPADSTKSNKITTSEKEVHDKRGDIAGSSTQVFQQTREDEEMSVEKDALAMLPYKALTPNEGIQEQMDKGKEVIIQDIGETQVGGTSIEQKKMPTSTTAKHLDVAKVLQTIPRVDTKKMQKNFEAKDKRGMGGLVDYARFYPLGLTFTRQVSVLQCDLAPDEYKCRPLSKPTVTQLVQDFGEMPKPCSFAADLMPYDPITNQPIKRKDFKKEKLGTYRYWILGGQHSILAARAFLDMDDPEFQARKPLYQKRIS